jgi:hypothetical protein
MILSPVLSSRNKGPSSRPISSFLRFVQHNLLSVWLCLIPRVQWCDPSGVPCCDPCIDGRLVGTGQCNLDRSTLDGGLRSDNP